MKSHENETDEQREEREKEKADSNRLHDVELGSLADKFIKVKNMLGHVRLQCRICKSSFKFVNGARKHYLTHVPHLKGVPGKEWRCATCSKVFSDRRYLLRHEVTHATQRAVYECSHCQQKFKWKFYFKKHMLQKHAITVDDAMLQAGTNQEGLEEGEMLDKNDGIVHELDTQEELHLPDQLNAPDNLGAADHLNAPQTADTVLQEETSMQLPRADVEQLSYSAASIADTELVYTQVDGEQTAPDHLNASDELNAPDVYNEVSAEGGVYNEVNAEGSSSQELVYSEVNADTVSNEMALLEAVASSGLDLNVALDLTNMGNQMVCTGDGGNVEGQTFKLVAYPDPTYGESESAEESYVILQVAIPPGEPEQEPVLGNEVDVDGSAQAGTEQ